MNLIDAAYERQMSSIRSRVVRELLELEKEITDARKNMRAAWNKLCEAEGLKPSDIQKMERLEVSEGNEELGSNCLIFTRLFVAKISKYKKLCRLHGIKPDEKIVNTKEVNNESSASNTGKGQKPKPDSGRGQFRSGGSRRVSRRGKKRQRG